jgi:glycosyltransferase involved in cell wall biosynthesis
VRKFYHLSDMLVGVAENYRDLFTNKYGVPVGKIAIVRNGCNEDLFYPGPKENSFRTRNKLEGKFLCSFVGNVGNFLRCETLVRAAYILRDDPDIVFVFVGEGAGLTRVRQVKEELNADNVLILGNLPREEVPDVLRASDVSIAHAMNHPYYMTCVGAKIWEIMGSGVPILVGFKGETQQIVEGARAGFAFQPENEEEMASLIVKIKDDPGLASQLGKNGRKYILSGFTRRQLASKYLDAMNSILGININ